MKHHLTGRLLRWLRRRREERAALRWVKRADPPPMAKHLASKMRLCLPLLIAAGLGGCAVGRGDDGSIVLGTKIGQAVETANQALIAGVNAAISGATGGWGSILGQLLPAAIGIGGAAVAAHAKGKDTGWNAAVLEGATTIAPRQPPPIAGPQGVA